MTAERATSGNLTFYCDGCSEDFVSCTRLWDYAWAEAYVLGWRAHKTTKQVWEHNCADCVRRYALTDAGPRYVGGTPPEAVPKVPTVTLPTDSSERSYTHRIVHHTIFGLLQDTVPGLTDPIRRAIASKAAVDLRERLVASEVKDVHEKEIKRLCAWLNRIDGMNDNPSRYSSDVNDAIIASREGLTVEQWHDRLVLQRRAVIEAKRSETDG